MTNPSDEPLIQYLVNTGNKYSNYGVPEVCENCLENDGEEILVADETAVPFIVCDKCFADFKKLVEARKKK